MISRSRKHFGLIAFALGAAIIATAAGYGAEAGKTEQRLGSVADFALRDLDGKPATPRDFQGAKAVVLLFLGTQCPVSNGYAPTMAELASSCEKRGVIVVGVHSDPSVTSAAAREHAKEYALDFRILLDPDQSLARQAQVATTPEAVVLLPDGKIVYRGRIDNRYSSEGKRRLEATRHELRAAIDAVLAGRKPDPAVTPAFGCPLPKRRVPASE